MKTIGHESVKALFRRTLQRGRLASTYLFVGAEGIGKRTFANDLTKVLLCQSQSAVQDLAACGRCESCKLADGEGHPDLLTVAKPAGKSSLPIDLFLGRPDHRNREGLCHEISLKPYLSTRRIAIIDDADDLGIESANCLLKTLEEPPPHSLLMLIGTSLSKQLPTIRSRSQVVRFGSLSTEEVAAVLQRRGLLLDENEDQPAAESEITALAAASQGSVSKALAARDHDLAAFREQVIRILSSEAFDPIRFAAAVVEQSQAGGAEPAARRERLKTIIGYAIDHYRDRLRDDAAKGMHDSLTVERLDRSLTAIEAVDRNANQATVIQTWLTGLSAVSQPVANRSSA
ncbi:MAG: DNA polymerase III subunit [Planctomycetota bacterium]